MRRFDVYCIDTVTKMQMILSEATYNMACSFIEHTLKVPVDDISTEVLENGMTAIKKAGKTVFVYDEGRGYLLRPAN